MLECSISRTLLSLTPREKCLPWYYPAVDADARMCNPFEARNFSKIMKKMDTEQCKVKIEIHVPIDNEIFVFNEPYYKMIHQLGEEVSPTIFLPRVPFTCLGRSELLENILQNLYSYMMCLLVNQCFLSPTKHCLPDCDETLYSASVSASPFRSCDSKNVGLTDLCDLGGGSGEVS